MLVRIRMYTVDMYNDANSDDDDGDDGNIYVTIACFLQMFITNL